MIYPAFVEVEAQRTQTAEYDQIVNTSDGTLDVGIYTIPEVPNTKEPTKLKIDFLRSGTERIQEHIDYRVNVIKDGEHVFGPMTRLLHTSPGSLTIPVEFSENGLHIVQIEMEGILFQPIPLETATLTINVGQVKINDKLQVYLDNIIDLLNRADSTYSSGDNDLALKLVTEAYLENYEYLEGPLMEVDEELMIDIEIEMREELRDMIKYRMPASDVSLQIDTLLTKLGIAAPMLNLTMSTPETSIPDWIKSNAGWWADGQIDDSSFVSGIQWLISNDVMTIPPTEQGAGSDNMIPDWIKSNAGWWADGQIDDSSFVSGLQWLISNGIMKIS